MQDGIFVEWGRIPYGIDKLQNTCSGVAMVYASTFSSKKYLNVTRTLDCHNQPLNDKKLPETKDITLKNKDDVIQYYNKFYIHVETWGVFIPPSSTLFP